MSYHVFISYSQKDGDVAASLASKLLEAGLKPFMADRSILAAAEWEPQLRDALRMSDSVLLLMTPRSKDSLWVAAEAGAAWVLDKPLIPVLMFVEPHQLFEPVRKYQARVVETPEQMEALARELYQLSPAAASLSRLAQAQGPQFRSPSIPCESFNSSSAWEALLRVGEWAYDPSSKAIIGEGMYRYLLSSRLYGPAGFKVRCRLTFLELHPESSLNSVNAGIVLGWRVPKRARQYHHLMFTGTRLLLEHIGSRDGTEYLDFEHIDEGVPFSLDLGRPYELSVRLSSSSLEVLCDGREVYALRLAQPIPSGRVGLRPWRSRMKCERFEVVSEPAD